jgi:hypothetical protein
VRTPVDEAGRPRCGSGVHAAAVDSRGAPLGTRVAFRELGFGKTRTQTKRAAGTEKHVWHVQRETRRLEAQKEMIADGRAASLLPHQRVHARLRRAMGEKDRMRGFGSWRKSSGIRTPSPQPSPLWGEGGGRPLRIILRKLRSSESPRHKLITHSKRQTTAVTPMTQLPAPAASSRCTR